jgi:hypothetical protein
LAIWGSGCSLHVVRQKQSKFFIFRPMIPLKLETREREIEAEMPRLLAPLTRSVTDKEVKENIATITRVNGCQR